MMNIDTMQKQGQENLDVAMKSMTAMTKGFQDIAKETAEYAKKSFETSSAAAEKMMAAKSLDKAFEVQADYAKSAYESFVAEATKIGELYADIAKEAYKPFESALPKMTK
ncbi:MAG: phasin family protein [Salaquimonas sp.]|nr:phasin family protein [Salaquimonas sp.]